MTRLARILLVEDNPGDVVLVRHTLEDAGLANDLVVVSDGAEALDYLRGEGQYAGSPRPDLVLLDINLPRVDGHEVLATVKSDPVLRRIPVVMLTSSAADADVARAYDHHANAYLTKGFGLAELATTVRGIADFWLGVVTLPPHDD